jgi:signal transduction histidine kinase/HAMP domain-containing protein
MGLFRFRRGIGEKILIGFVAMAMLIIAMGAYGYHVLTAAAYIVANTYDRPLMTVNQAQSAAETFTAMQRERYRRASASPAEQAVIDHEMPRLAKAFHRDLEIARGRAPTGAERAVIDAIDHGTTLWQRQWGATDTASRVARAHIASAIAASFNQLVTMTAADSRAERGRALAVFERYEYTTLFTVLIALIAAAFITYILARHIVQPLATAAKVADRIASGQLDTVIPRGFDDETGILLHSMSVMRDAIRTMMARERMQRRSAQTRLADALESSHEGMILVDAMGNIVDANSQFGEFFPRAARACVAGVEFNAVEPTITEHLLNPTSAPKFMSLPATGSEFQLADNRWIRVSRSQTRDGGAFFFFTDFTEVKAREQRYREAQLEAEAASRAKSSFLANMSHELRTPLNAIIGFSEIMQKEMYGAVGNPHYTTYIHDILQSGRHLLAIINGVLDLAKSQSGKLKIRHEPVEMREITADCVAMMRDQCARGGLALEYEEPREPLIVSGEPAKLRQVLLNLLSNAVKFTEPGGRIAITAGQAAGIATIEVTDTGIGMTPAEVVVALTPFGQVDNRLARRYEGTGLGLPLAKELVELHGGTLTIVSEPGHGTTVRMAMPVLAVEPVAMETVAA